MDKFIITIKIFIVIIILSGLYGCCPNGNLPPNVYMVGKTIKNPPSWLWEKSGDETFSEWMEWTDDNPLIDYIPESLNKSGYKGKYRLLANIQDFAIEFDDGTAVTFLFLWLGDIEGDDTDFIIQQTNPNIFSFEGFIKHQHTDNPKEKASITYTLQETTDLYSKFAVQLNVAGKEIIKGDFKALKEAYYTINTIPQWLTNEFTETDSGNIKYQFLLWADPNTSITSKGFLCFSVRRYGYNSLGKITTNELFYHGGMKQVSLDDSQKKVVYQLLDGAPNSPRYVELHRNTDTTVLFTWFNLPEGQEDPTTNRSDLREETLYVQK